MNLNISFFVITSDCNVVISYQDLTKVKFLSRFYETILNTKSKVDFLKATII